ncbi:RWD-domain-containing protein [Macrolepiota fuliginosa MF-IS2]|uniref:RWD-domain-containing protein n=1 Tax=Macrolepiota fuliginosa MF-IS2 TaxID=1400762 RepID=A0A9P5XIJ8_9AGAR|nr:RWD-domain-containing protein [Macrolepiota fuliginosa MF-IS2]
MSSDVLAEELEVLEAIYPTELTKLSDTDVQIDAEPEDVEDGTEPLKITLKVHYTNDYPQSLPELSLDPVDTEFSDEEIDRLLQGLRDVGEDNLGMAMTFTLVSHLREQLAQLLRERIEKRNKEEQEKERLELEAARTRGTPVTVVSFNAWKAKFDKEMAQRKSVEEEEKLKASSPKEREEYRKYTTRLTGRQLFERNRHLEDEGLMEDGTVSVDASQYERTRLEEQEEDEGVTFSDSD